MYETRTRVGSTLQNDVNKLPKFVSELSKNDVSNQGR